jgi:UDP-N-acetylmuramoyl-tripeptide--D-alanyl-D-alanine ligase
MSKLLQTYFRFWAKRYLARVKPQIVAITGSVGKTSAKEAIFEVLKIKFGGQARKSFGNLNTETGVPLAILGFENSPSNWLSWFPIIFAAPLAATANSDTKVLVLEMAADKPGDIAYLTSFVKPHIAVLTSIGPAHLSAFGTLEKIASEKTGLLRALPKDGWAVLNIDNEYVRKASYGGWWRKMTYGQELSADVKFSNVTARIKSFQAETSFDLVINNVKKSVSLAMLGEPFVYAALAAYAVGQIFETKENDIMTGLKNVKPEKHRMNIFAGLNGSIIIDDSYNANPVSMKAALEILKNLPADKGGRKITVLGDMREIGKITDEEHRLIGEYAKEVADVVVGVGDLAKKYKGQKYFTNADLASEYLLNEVKENDILLIKASRAIGLDEIADKLKTEVK